MRVYDFPVAPDEFSLAEDDLDPKSRVASPVAPWTRTSTDRVSYNCYVNIVGRIKDMIIRGGENVYPREIEEFLYSHPAILDVQVIGVPSQKYGEEVMAWVKLTKHSSMKTTGSKAE